jgi:hypothetical protein
MKLAAISGVNGPFSDADIRRVRRLALAARARGAATPAPTKRTKKKEPPPAGQGRRRRVTRVSRAE